MDKPETTLDEKDIRMDCYRNGAGANYRFTHLPSGHQVESAFISNSESHHKAKAALLRQLEEKVNAKHN